MENRIAKLEVATEYIQRDAAALREGFGGVAESIAQSRERLVTIETRLEHMPTKLEMWLGVGAILLTAGGGLWWLVQQYLGPMLANAAGG